ncbi:hypothetical protein EV426DRAFT_250165 [Tirmania nivea]|nr:hypothetical protein EV426DRAFT_250165 [Tirmania nivea]
MVCCSVVVFSYSLGSWIGGVLGLGVKFFFYSKFFFTFAVFSSFSPSFSWLEMKEMSG